MRDFRFVIISGITCLAQSFFNYHTSNTSAAVLHRTVSFTMSVNLMPVWRSANTFTKKRDPAAGPNRPRPGSRLGPSDGLSSQTASGRPDHRKPTQRRTGPPGCSPSSCRRQTPRPASIGPRWRPGRLRAAGARTPRPGCPRRRRWS